MLYGDEKIAKSWTAEKRLQKWTIRHGVEIREARYTFARKELFDGAFSMIMPEQFEELRDELAQAKYPSVDRPQLIYSGIDGMADLTYSYTEYAIRPSEIENSIQGFRAVIKRMYPANTFYKTIWEPKAEIPWGYFDYRSYALDDDLYNLFYIAAIQERLLLGTFSCPHDDRKAWSPLVLQMIDSIAVEEYEK